VYVEEGPGTCFWLQLVQFCCILYHDKTPVIILIIDGFPAVNVQMLHVNM